MFRRTISVLALVAVTATSISCFSGPRRLSRTWDDHVNQRYAEDSRVHGALLQDLLPVYTIVGIAAGLGDLFVNAYYFWSDDAWDGNGTAFEHRNPKGTAKTVTGSGL